MVKDHLGGTHNSVAPCLKILQEVKYEICAYMKAFETTKHTNQQNFEEMVEEGSYFVGGSGSGIFPSDSRGIRRLMDRFMTSKKGDKYGTKMSDGVGDIRSANAKEHRNQVCLDIGIFFFENGLAFKCLRSPSFDGMAQSLGNYGRNLKFHSMHKLSTWILKKEVQTTSKIVDEIKATSKETGFSLLSDSWSDMRNMNLINFLVNNQHGTIFLKTVDDSDYGEEAKLFELLDGVVEEI